MSASLDDLTYDQEVDGALARKQLDKVILTGGAWATVLFLYQEMAKTGGYGAPKVSVVRFQKARGAYRQHSSFKIASEDQAAELISVLERWRPLMATEADDEGEVEDRRGAGNDDGF